MSVQLSPLRFVRYVFGVDIGLDRLPGLPRLCARLKGARLGVLAHAASVDRQLVHVLPSLRRLGIAPALLFGPEHGFGGGAQDMVAVPDGSEITAQQRVISLYGDSLEELVPKQEHLRELDVLLIDLVDVGARYYTFVWTALLAYRAAAALGVHTIIIDRPNPLSGALEAVEGKKQRTGYTSFVGWEPVPIRHGMTLGEMVARLAALDGAVLGPSGALSVVAVEGWQRDSLAPQHQRGFVLPSPNMPTFDTMLVYPGGCLLEGTNLSEGRGHTRPFEFVGAPWIDGERLAQELMALGLPGFVARPTIFVPTFHKHAGKPCGGVQIHVVDPAVFRPVASYLALIALARNQDPERFRFRTERYEFIDDIPAFDLLTGSALAREAIDAQEDPRALAEATATPDPGWGHEMEAAQEALRAAAWPEG